MVLQQVRRNVLVADDQILIIDAEMLHQIEDFLPETEVLAMMVVVGACSALDQDVALPHAIVPDHVLQDGNNFLR